jgi:hypothetical protein
VNELVEQKGPQSTQKGKEASKEQRRAVKRLNSSSEHTHRRNGNAMNEIAKMLFC